MEHSSKVFFLFAQVKKSSGEGKKSRPCILIFNILLEYAVLSTWFGQFNSFMPWLQMHIVACNNEMQLNSAFYLYEFFYEFSDFPI